MSLPVSVSQNYKNITATTTVVSTTPATPATDATTAPAAAATPMAHDRLAALTLRPITP